MIIFYLIFFIIFNAVNAAEVHPLNHYTIEKQIITMVKEDDKIRNEILSKQRQLGSNAVKVDSSLFLQLQAIDKKHTYQLQHIFLAIGWPSRTKFQSQTREAFWTLIQHSSDLNLQKTALKELGRVCKKDPSELKHYAYLWDRIQMNQNKPQLFGTQGRCLGPHHWEAFDLIDKKNIDQLRKKMNLISSERYQKMMRKLCY